jgi:hypothetical protein
MPAGDRTGPRGMGSRSGRAAGYCAGFERPGYANPGLDRGFGMGSGPGRGFGGGGGGGRGWRHMFHATGKPGWMRFGASAAPYLRPDPNLEKQALKDQADALQSELDFIKNRLSKIETAAAAE